MLRDWWSDLRYRFRALTGRATVERELDAELRFHLEREAEELIRQGVPPAEALRRARLAFGSVEAVKESSRDARGLGALERVGKDLSRAFRQARLQPGFTLVVALSLALGIGATPAVWNLTYSVLFAPLEVPHPEQLVVLSRRTHEGSDIGFAWAEFTTLRQTPGLGRFASFRGASAITLEVDGRRESVNVHFVDGDYFALAGVAPLKGRLLTRADDASGAPVAVLAQWYADKLFPGDSAVLGRVIKLRGAAFTVVGILPHSFRGFEFPGWLTVAIPEGAVPRLAGYGPGRDNRGQPYGREDVRRTAAPAYHIVGRLALPAQAAQAALGQTFARCCRATPDEALELVDIRLGLGGGKEDIRVGGRLVLTLLLGGMALVLVVICCNVASLLLVRASARQRELAVRLALGASRGRLISQLVAESLPYALLGGLGGLLVAQWATAAFLHNLPPDWVDAADAQAILGFHWGPAFGFSAMITLGCMVGFALYPALRASGQRLAQSLRLEARASRSRGQGRVARGVVLTQVATTVVLVSAATLFSATLGNLSRMDGGYAVNHVLLANLEARSTPWEPTGLGAVHRRILEAIRAVPGVKAATLSFLIPLFGGNNWPAEVRVPGYQPGPGEETFAWINGITPGFFATTGVALTGGRDFSDADRAGAAAVGIVNRTFARRYFGTANPLDRSVAVSLTRNGPTSVRIVGLAADAKYEGLRAEPKPMLYLPMLQTPEDQVHLSLFLRSEGEPLALEQRVRDAVEAAAPGLIVRRVRDMAGERRDAVTLERLAARLAGFVGGMALVLSAIGLYGIVAYSVTRRTSEIGVRIALGAGTRDVVWLVARETLALVGAGVLLGIPLSYLGAMALRTQLYGVGSGDPRGALLAVLLLGAAGVAASTLPARRAAGIDPRIALNAD